MFPKVNRDLENAVANAWPFVISPFFVSRQQKVRGHHAGISGSPTKAAREIRLAETERGVLPRLRNSWLPCDLGVSAGFDPCFFNRRVEVCFPIFRVSLSNR